MTIFGFFLKNVHFFNFSYSNGNFAEGERRADDMRQCTVVPIRDPDSSRVMEINQAKQIHELTNTVFTKKITNIKQTQEIISISA